MKKIRDDFPILNKEINGNKIVYLDSAATSQTPNQVVDKVVDYVKNSNGNPHRGSHSLSINATNEYEAVRDKVKDFISAKSRKEIIFTKSTTEATNLVAYSWGLNNLKKGDKIVVTIADHHSNIVVWQEVAKKTGAVLDYMYLDSDYRLDIKELDKIDSNTKMVSITHMSNVLGTIMPVKDVIEKAKSVGAKTLIDGAQAIPHMKIDVEDLDCDFYVFSGHKMLSFGGVGVLYGKEEILNEMDPFLFGGDMIEYVEEQSSTYNILPYKFEAGTQPIESIISLGAAVDYINDLGYDFISKNEKIITEYALGKLKELDFIKIIGPDVYKDRGSVISFLVEGVHSHDVSTILDSYGVMTRSGHHCAQPLMNFLGINSSSRASFYFYNTKEDVDMLVDSLSKVRSWMGYGTR